MTFYLGKDVSVFLTTENTTLGVSPATGSTSVVNSATATFAAKLGGTVTEQSDLTAVDLSIGAMDEDIAYFGMRTALKALEYGYRAYVHLSGTSEVMTIPNCVVTSHSVTINSDGTTDESIELMSMVTPVVSGANYATPTLQANL